MSRAVLIFGAGLNQLTLIEAAKQLGLVAVVIDPAENPPGKDKADHFYQVGAEDYFATKEIAIKHEVVGIATSQMERPLKLMSLLAQDMGYTFHTPEVVARSTNKYLMKRAFLAGKVPCAQGNLIGSYRILEESEFASYDLPVVIKPLCGFSSRGVYIVDSYRSYLKEIGSTLSFTQDGSYLIEEYINGPEYSAESITFQGKTQIVQYTSKLITPYPYTVELGHVQPASFSSEQKKQAGKIVARAIEALGIDNSAAHTEFKCTSSGPVVIEVGPRLGGDFITSHLTLASSGVNMDKATIQVALGQSPDLTPTCDLGSVIMYLDIEQGYSIANIDNRWKKIKEYPGVLDAYLAVSPGDTTQRVSDSSKRQGWVITKSRTSELARVQALEALDALRKCIHLEKEV